MEFTLKKRFVFAHSTGHKSNNIFSKNQLFHKKDEYNMWDWIKIFESRWWVKTFTARTNIYLNSNMEISFIKNL